MPFPTPARNGTQAVPYIAFLRWYHENKNLDPPVCGHRVRLYFSDPSLLRQDQARFAEITSRGELVNTVDLMIDQEFTVDGKNTVTVEDGKIAVTWADCPDHYCMKRGYCSGGTDIVCLPNRLVISFLGEQEVDAAIG